MPHNPQPVAPAERCGECAELIHDGNLCVECALDAARLAVREACSYVTRVEVEGEDDDD